MKYYGERTKKLYDTAEACQTAEFEAKEKENRALIEKERKERELKEQKEKAIAERKAMASDVDTARKAYLEAQKVYREKLEGFCKKYGTYHYTVENGDEIPSLFDVFGNFFKF